MNVANTLVAFSLGLVFNGLALLFTRAFFARQESRVPTEVACINLVLNAVLDLLLYKPLGAAGIALGTSIVTSWNAAALAVLLRRRVGSLHMREVAGETGRIAIATAFCAAAASVVWWPLDSLLGRSFPAQVVSLGAAFIAAGARLPDRRPDAATGGRRGDPRPPAVPALSDPHASAFAAG